MTDAYRDAIFPESITEMGKILKLFLHIGERCGLRLVCGVVKS